MRNSRFQLPAWAFLKGFLREPRTVGSIAPSSRWLVGAMLDEAGVDTAQVIAEFGPGTGVFTDEIIRRMQPDARLLVFEVHRPFFASLRERIRDPRVELIAESAAEVGQHLQRLGLQQIDCIVSGLPFTSLPRPVTHAILQATAAALRPGGVFVTYQYTPVLRGLLRSYFPTARITRYVLRNIPPALVFVCRKPA
ncbi:MAG TPA: methyltransferase domain-containing protein [Herpetosiphonaceae bacterium]